MNKSIHKYFLLVWIVLGLFIGCKSANQSKYITIGMVDGWAEDVAMTHVAKAILDEKGYHVVIQKASTDMILASMNNEDTDLFLGVWLPYTHASKVAKFPELDTLGTSYSNGKIGLVVPDYIPINSIDELNNYSKKFNNQTIGIEKGAGMTKATDLAIKDYQLEYQQINSSTIAMITELQNAIQTKKWIVVAGWQPHWMFAKMKLKFLEDPKKSFGETEEIKIFARKSFSKDHPELTKFFGKMKFTDEQLTDLLAKMQDSHDKELAAKEWVKDHRSLVESWFEN